MDATTPQTVAVINLLTHVDHIDDLGGWVTAAAMSPNGARLAVLVQAPAAALWVFDAPPVGDAFFSRKILRLQVTR